MPVFAPVTSATFAALTHLPALSRGDRRQLSLVELAPRDHDDPAAGRRSQRRSPHPTLERGPDAEDCAGPDLGDDVAVDLHVEHPVENEVKLAAGLVLLDERLALFQLAPGQSLLVV